MRGHYPWLMVMLWKQKKRVKMGGRERKRKKREKREEACDSWLQGPVSDEVNGGLSIQAIKSLQ